jgi:hypothetical protein
MRKYIGQPDSSNGTEMGLDRRSFERWAVSPEGILENSRAGISAYGGMVGSQSAG